jgi:hypothetical protein
MNRKIPLIACLLAFAGMSVATEPPRQNYECDTPAGHFGYWNRTVSASKIDVTGTLTVNELRKDGKWIATALVVLRGADEKARFGVHLYTLPKIKDMYFVEIVKPSGNEKLGLGVMPATKEPLPFAIHLDGADQLTVSLGSFDASVPAGDFKSASIEFSCSTGDFEFKDFAIQETAAN